MTSLRWYEPDQVLRVKSQPHCVKNKHVTPRVKYYYDPLMSDDQLILRGRMKIHYC